MLIQKPLSSDVKSALDTVIHAKKTPVLTGHHRRHNKIIKTEKKQNTIW